MNKIYTVNSTFFDGEISTENQAYLLGLLYSDGWVSTCKKGSYLVGISSIDIELINYVKEILQSNHPIYLNKKYSENHSQGYTLAIYNKQLVLDIKEKGCIENKSLILTFPEIRENLKRHFIRGLWDGDGSVYRKGPKCLRMKVLGTIDIIRKVQSYLFSVCNKPGYIRAKGNVFELEYTSGSFLIHSHLYADCQYSLSRKANI